MDKLEFTIELTENDIDGIAFLTDMKVETSEDLEEAIRKILYELF